MIQCVKSLKAVTLRAICDPQQRSIREQYKKTVEGAGTKDGTHCWEAESEIDSKWKRFC